MKLLTVFLLTTGLLFAPACNRLNLSGDKDTKRDRGDDDDFELDKISEKEIQDALKSIRNCAEYEHGHNTFRILNVFGKSMEHLENCISKALDKSVGKICIEEKKLNRLEKKYKNDENALEQIDDYRGELEYLKEDIADQLYNIADIFDEMAVRLVEEFEEEINEETFFGPLAIGLGTLLIESEVGGFTDFFELRANRICGYNVLSSLDGGSGNRDD